MVNRRYVLAGVVAALGVLTAAILLEVLGTILFAITVAYVLVPVQGWLVRRGLSEWIAAVAATLIGFLGAVAAFSPIFVTLYFRRDELVGLFWGLPSELTLTAFGTSTSIEATTVRAWAIDQVQALATSLALAAPELAVKFALFVLLLFALVLRGYEASRAIVAPVPHEYRDVVYALGLRARETLYAIYVLQLATAGMTLFVGYPFFWMLGYDGAFTLAMIAAVLQFVPIIGPSMLVVPIALYHLAVGELAAAVLVGVLGVLLIGWLPDVTVRPRMAEQAAGLPGSLYFVGFTGGLFTLGAIGIVVGPLIVAVFVEAVDLLAAEVNDDRTPTLEEYADAVAEGTADEAASAGGPAEDDTFASPADDAPSSPADDAPASPADDDPSSPADSSETDANGVDVADEGIDTVDE